MNNRSALTVRYRWPLFVSLLCWASGWLCAAYLLLHPDDLLPKSPGAITNQLIPGVFLAFGILFGPVVSGMYSTVIEISASAIEIRRWFGLSRKTYARSQVHSLVQSEKSLGISWFEIHFADARKVRIERSAENAELAEHAITTWLQGEMK